MDLVDELIRPKQHVKTKMVHCAIMGGNNRFTEFYDLAKAQLED